MDLYKPKPQPPQITATRRNGQLFENYYWVDPEQLAMGA